MIRVELDVLKSGEMQAKHLNTVLLDSGRVWKVFELGALFSWP
jgi:hypothetical protein